MATTEVPKVKQSRGPRLNRLVFRYLLETLDPSKIAPQDVRTVLAVVAANPEGRLLAWRHLKAYWPTMQTLFGNATYMMGGLISAVTAHLSMPYDYHEVGIHHCFI